MHVPVPSVTRQVLTATSSGGPPRTSFQAKSGVALISQLCCKKNAHEKGGDHLDHANSSRCSAGGLRSYTVCDVQSSHQRLQSELHSGDHLELAQL